MVGFHRGMATVLRSIDPEHKGGVGGENLACRVRQILLQRATT